jgi:integrase/recombinase XerD
MLYAGLRVREMTELRPMDITTPEAKEMAIQLYVMGKGRKGRRVYLNRKIASELEAYLAERAPCDAREPLFRNRFERPMATSGVENRVKTYGERSGVQVTCHRLRHTYAATLLNNGLTIDALRRLVGHKDLTTTLIYARLADTTVETQYQAAMERISNLTSQLNVSTVASPRSRVV